MPQIGNLGLIDIRARPPEALPFRAGVAQTGFYTFLDQGTLELSHGADDLKHQPAGGCAEIEVIAQADEGQS